jgi:hypothetical protein
MLDTETYTTEIEQREMHPLVSTSLGIIGYRLSTLPQTPMYDEYRASMLTNIAILEQAEPSTLARKMIGPLSEALFFTACRENLQTEISISTAQEDMQGVDFFLGSAKRRIDVTTNPGKYSSKMFKTDKTTIILPPRRDLIKGILLEGEDFDTRQYLRDIFELNMEILNNRYPQYQILIAPRAKKRNSFNAVASRGYKRRNLHSNPTGHRDKVYMKEAQYREVINVLSILRNFST